MKPTTLCTLSLVMFAAVLLQHADAWIRIRRISIRIGKRGNTAGDCPFTCKRYCPDGSCYVLCANACTLKAKGAEDKHLKPFPHVFKTYDQDIDGFITLQEFSGTLHADQESSSAALKLADDNGDGRLDEKEFDEAPFSKAEPGEDVPVPKALRELMEADEDGEDGFSRR